MPGNLNEYQNQVISGKLKQDISLFQAVLQKDALFRIKGIRLFGHATECAVLYMDGMTDAQELNEGVIRPLLTLKLPVISRSIAEDINRQILFAKDVKKGNKLDALLGGILYGEAVLLIDGSADALQIDVKGWKTRGIEEPEGEKVFQGPREGFDEAVLHNVSLIRRKLQTPDLCFEKLTVGRRSKTTVYLSYLDSLADAACVARTKKQIEAIDIDGILDSNYISELIRTDRRSVFKTIGSTERPDITAARLLEGRIAILVDGTPVVLTIPYLFSENFQSDEDYYVGNLIASVGRLLRYVSFFLAVSIPALFIALSSFHRQLLPTALTISVAQLRSGVPFGTVAECLLMIFVFEILLQTGLRTTESLGSTLSIVGGLVVGQAAVEARIISAPMLIVVALSGVAGLMIPRLRSSVFFLRLGFLLLGAFCGILGYFIGLTVVILHICSLHSAGVDYTVSLRRADSQTLKDTIVRASFPRMKTRPVFNRNRIRMGKEKE